MVMIAGGTASAVVMTSCDSPTVSSVLLRPPMIGICFPLQQTLGSKTRRRRFGSSGQIALVTVIMGLMFAIHRPVCVDATVWPTNQQASTKQMSLRQNRNLQSSAVIYNDLEAIIRQVIPRFRLELSPAPNRLTLQDENDLAGIMDKVLVSYFQSKSSLYPDLGTTMDYILLAGIESDDWYSNASGRSLAGSTAKVVLTFKGGVAYFRGVSAPGASQVTAWVKEGLELQLPAALAGTPYSYVQSAIFTTQTGAPSPAPIRQHVTDGAQLQEYKTNNSPSKGLISGSVVGAFALFTIALVALLITRRRSGKRPDEGQPKATCKVDTASSASPVESDLANLQPRLQKQKQKQHQKQHQSTQLPVVLPLPVQPAPLPRLDDDDGASLFTASTRTDHSNMLPTTSGAAMRPNVAIESFERERPMALRKDMMDSTWNRSTSPGRTYPSPTRPKIQNDTVLQPSYFSASGERRRRKKKPRSDGGEKEEEWYFSESKEEVGQEGFRFESANGGNEGEEVFLVPPSPRSAIRAGSSSDSAHSLV